MRSNGVQKSHHFLSLQHHCLILMALSWMFLFSSFFSDITQGMLMKKNKLQISIFFFNQRTLKMQRLLSDLRLNQMKKKQLSLNLISPLRGRKFE